MVYFYLQEQEIFKRISWHFSINSGTEIEFQKLFLDTMIHLSESHSNLLSYGTDITWIQIDNITITSNIVSKVL